MKKIIILFLATYLIGFANSTFAALPSFPLTEQYTSNEIINDHNFSELIKQTFKTRDLISSQLYNKGGRRLVEEYNTFTNKCYSFNTLFEFYTEKELDTTMLIESHVDEIAVQYKLISVNPVLLKASEEERIIIIKNAFLLLKDPKFRKENANNPAVIELENIINGKNTVTEKLTTTEALDCIMDGALGAIGAVGGIVGTIVGIASGSGLSTSVLRNLIKNAIRVGAFSAGGTAIAYMVGCILWQAWD